MKARNLETIHNNNYAGLSIGKVVMKEGGNKKENGGYYDIVVRFKPIFGEFTDDTVLNIVATAFSKKEEVSLATLVSRSYKYETFKLSSILVYKLPPASVIQDMIFMEIASPRQFAGFRFKANIVGTNKFMYVNLDWSSTFYYLLKNSRWFAWGLKVNPSELPPFKEFKWKDLKLNSKRFMSVLARFEKYMEEYVSENYLPFKMRKEFDTSGWRSQPYANTIWEE